jgi:hypothetical protein
MSEPLFFPSREWVEGLKVGDFAPGMSGKPSLVKEIIYRGVDINGRAYVGVNLDFGPGSSISDSYKEDEVHRSVALSFRFKSHEIDAIERAARAGRPLPEGVEIVREVAAP